MAHYIDKDALVAEIERRKKQNEEWKKSCKGIDSLAASMVVQEDLNILSFIDTLEGKDVDLELITGWFDHIAQIADDRMTLTNQRMTDAHALDEIKCLAKNSSEFIKIHYKAQKGE